MTDLALYELAGAEDDRLFSPYCWRARLALEHKGLAFASIPWRFTEKDAIAGTGQGRVPVLRHGDRLIHDSWAIACHLEESFPNRPSVFGGDAGRALSRFVADWVDTVVHSALPGFMMADMQARLHEKDKAYHRQSREARFGVTLEQLVEGREDRLAGFRQLLAPARATLSRQPFLGGDVPCYGDIALAAAFHCAAAISPLALLAEDDPVAAWRGRMAERLSPQSRALRVA